MSERASSTGLKGIRYRSCGSGRPPSGRFRTGRRPKLSASASVAAAVAALWLLATGTAIASHQPSESGGPARDFAVGGGQTTVGGTMPAISFALSSHSGPLGEDPWGSVEENRAFPPYSIRVRVTCLRVDGNRATIGGEVVQAEGLPPTIRGVRYYVEDNGPPGQGVPDGIQGFGFPFVPPVDDCPLAFPAYHPPPIDRGNIVVHDAP